MHSIKIPPLVEAKQTLPTGESVDVPAKIAEEWERLNLAEAVRGKRIALGFGSRGVAQVDIIARELVKHVKQSGGEPFVVPAMGSHGGGTPAGQIEVLSGLGITEDSVGCPIHATMDVVDMGMTDVGLPAYLDKNVAEADGLILTNRVKVHTDFHGPHESGLLKMLAIGLGKETGARNIHRYGTTGLREYMPRIAEYLVSKINWIAGFATVEDGYHNVAHIEALTADCVIPDEQRLLQLSRDLMPRIPVDEIDVLIIDEMGKDISGAGMDTNIIGRWMISGEPEPETPNIKRICILDLTPASHGNATAYGLADFMSKRLFDKIDFPITIKNIFTSGFLQRGQMPMVFETDEETIKAAVFDTFRRDIDNHHQARVVRIQNTLALETLWVSQNIADELRGQDGMTVSDTAEVLTFNEGWLF